MVDEVNEAQYGNYEYEGKKTNKEQLQQNRVIPNFPKAQPKPLEMEIYVSSLKKEEKTLPFGLVKNIFPHTSQ